MNCVYFYVLVHKTHFICDKKGSTLVSDGPIGKRRNC